MTRTRRSRHAAKAPTAANTKRNSPEKLRINFPCAATRPAVSPPIPIVEALRQMNGFSKAVTTPVKHIDLLRMTLSARCETTVSIHSCSGARLPRSPRAKSSPVPAGRIASVAAGLIGCWRNVEIVVEFEKAFGSFAECAVATDDDDQFNAGFQRRASFDRRIARRCRFVSLILNAGGVELFLIVGQYAPRFGGDVIDDDERVHESHPQITPILCNLWMA